MDEFGIDEFHFVDDLFTLKQDWLYDFLSELEKNCIKVPWRCLVRVDRIKKEDMIQMKRHGCYQVEIGVESGNDQILKDIGKRITTLQVEKVFKWTKKAGLTTLAFFMFGHRLDTYKTIRQTLSFAKKISPDVCGFAVLLAFPGTKVYDSFLPEEIKYDWSKFSGYYERDKLPLSVSSLSAQELQQFGQQADSEVYGRIGFLLRNVLFRKGINYVLKKELFDKWLSSTKTLIKNGQKRNRIFSPRLRSSTFYYLCYSVSLKLIIGIWFMLSTIFQLGKRMSKIIKRSFGED